MAGTIPLSPSLDSLGPLARSVADCAALDAVLAGESDASLAALPPRGLRFALPQSVVLDELEPPVADAFARALSRLSAAGVRIVEIAFSELRELPALSFSVVEGYAWHRKLLQTRRSEYDPIVAGRFANGAAVSAADYIDLLNVRKKLVEKSHSTTYGFDAVVMPTVPLIAPPLADFAGNEPLWLATNRRMIRNPGIANFFDRCALSIPCHVPGEAPVGLSLMGETLADRRLLAIGLAVEKILS